MKLFQMFCWFVMAVIALQIPPAWAKKKAPPGLSKILAPVTIESPESKNVTVTGLSKTVSLTFKAHSTTECTEMTLRFRTKGDIELVDDNGPQTLPCEKSKVETITVQVRVKKGVSGKVILDATILTPENAQHAMSRSVWITAQEAASRRAEPSEPGKMEKAPPASEEPLIIMKGKDLPPQEK